MYSIKEEKISLWEAESFIFSPYFSEKPKSIVDEYIIAGRKS